MYQHYKQKSVNLKLINIKTEFLKAAIRKPFTQCRVKIYILINESGIPSMVKHESFADLNYGGFHNVMRLSFR